ncbi:DUF2239 family protein [Polaromonas sp.]|uniref:DUF2239 family protein n=1 Tax=Polaromonas sp. TaxID=1869339 RepID=UPI0032674A73
MTPSSGPTASAAPERCCTAFEESRRIATGLLSEVALKVKAVTDQGRQKSILVFDDLTSEQVELDLRGNDADVLGRLQRPDVDGGDAPAAPAPDDTPRGPGRPRLGVIAREVTLLPRHWEWLGSQPGGASVALRKLVEEARRTHEGKDRVRRAQESAYRFMSAIASSLPGFEEASRALFAGDSVRFDEQTQAWPVDLRHHALGLARLAFLAPEGTDAA